MKKLILMAAIMLTMPLMAQEEEVWHYTQGWIPSWYSTSINLDDIKAASTPKNMLEAVDRMPAFPTAEQIYTVEAKEKALRDIYQPYEKALFAAWDKNGEVSRDVDRRIKVAGEKQQKSNQKSMAQYQSNVNAGLMPSQEEMMQLYMSGEIKENMSEAQMMDVMAGKFAAKWGISKQEYIKIINMAQSNPKGTEAYLKSNHPDLYKRLYAANAPYGNENVHADDPRRRADGVRPCGDPALPRDPSFALRRQTLLPHLCLSDRGGRKAHAELSALRSDDGRLCHRHSSVLFSLSAKP